MLNVRTEMGENTVVMPVAVRPLQSDAVLYAQGIAIRRSGPALKPDQARLEELPHRKDHRPRRSDRLGLRRHRHEEQRRDPPPHQRQRYWFRVAGGIGAADQGPWSEPATKVAP